MNQRSKIKHTEYFTKMAFMYIPSESIDVKNKRLMNRRSFPEIHWHRLPYARQTEQNTIN